MIDTFSKKHTFILPALLVILNLVIRIPLVHHELGQDSFYIHQIADSITEYGAVKWVHHPIQFFGISTSPPALPIMISGYAQCLGICSELSILLLSIIAGLLCAIVGFVFIHHVTNDYYVSYLGALIFSLSPEVLRHTIWTATTRSFYLALLPLFLYLLFRSTGTKNRMPFIIFMFIISALLLATHRMGVLIFLYLCALFILFCITFLNKVGILKLFGAKITALVWITSFLLLFLSLVLKLSFFNNYPFLWNTYLSGRFFEGEGLYVVPVNLMIDYLGKMGILLPFAILGIITLLQTERRTFFESYALIAILVAAPIMGVGVYAPMVLLIIISFLVAIGVKRISNVFLIRKKIRFFLPAAIVLTLCFSMFMLVNWGTWTGEHIFERHNEQAQNTAFFINYYTNGTFTSNEPAYIYKYSVYSGVPGAPGYVYNYRFSYDVKLKAKLNLNLTDVIQGKGTNIIRLEQEGNESLELRDPWYEFGYVWATDPDGDRDLLDKYGIKYCVETNFDLPLSQFAKDKKLFEKMHESRPKIYDNELEEIYFIG